MITQEKLSNGGGSSSSLVKFDETSVPQNSGSFSGDETSLINRERLDSSDSVTVEKSRWPGAGQLVVRDNLIRFDDVPLVTPNGDVLIESLNIEVPSGTNVLICGPNGCGKSSLFRVLGELWPLWGGQLTKPAKGKLFYVPTAAVYDAGNSQGPGHIPR